MSPFRVSSVSSENRFRVQYGWKCGDKKGAFIKPAGLKAPARGTEAYNGFLKKLYSLVLGKQVEVGEVVNFSNGTLLCRVYYNGRELRDYFSEYKN
ncbi:MAG TPA: hypothetical protein ENN43_06890 [bacterium]|nr:hypothetical protein [bacterium]